MIANNFKKIGLIGLVSLFITGSFVAISPAANADVIQPDECFPAVLMLKGSDEGSWVKPEGEYYQSSITQKTYIHTNGHEGPTLNKLLKSFVNQTDPAKTVSKVRFIGVETPSLPVAPKIPEAPQISGAPGAVVSGGANAVLAANAWTNHIIKYNESYRVGAQMVLDVIEADVKNHNCNTQYMLLSYSQGVISARLAMNMLGNDTSKIISSYVMGDPFQKEFGASSASQFTDANTSRDTDGIARAALDTLITIGKSGGFITQGLVDGLSDYRNEMTSSDPFIYRDDVVYRDEGEANIVSRSLCHKKDPTCSFSELGISEHLNYFDPDTAAGAVDIDLEVAEFDKQVQTLATSTQSDPRERTLAKSPSLAGGTTSYNVTNTQPDDKCSWDEGSDGTEELVNVPCEIHNVTHTGESAKMTVTVTDSFDIPYVLNSEVKTVDPEIVEKISGLDANTWYHFTAYETVKDTENYYSPECLSWSQPASWPMIEEADENSYSNLTSWWGCNSSISDATNSTSVFKLTPYETPQGFGTRMVSAYDDNYAWTPGVPGVNFGHDIRLLPISSERTQNVTTKLVSVIDDRSYYTFQMGDECLTFVESLKIQLLECEPNSTNQLFSPSLAVNDFKDTSMEFGDLSYESDTKAPTDITGLRVETNSEAINLKWNDSEDNRGTTVEYLIYKKDNITGEFQYVVSHYGWANFAIDLNENTPGETYTYKIVAKDGAENLSNPSSITFVIPPLVGKPEAPLLENVTEGPSSVTLNIPSYPSPNTTGVKIYRDGQYLSTITSNTFIDTDVEPYRYYIYSYALEISDNVTSERSDDLWAATWVYDE